LSVLSSQIANIQFISLSVVLQAICSPVHYLPVKQFFTSNCKTIYRTHGWKAQARY